MNLCVIGTGYVGLVTGTCFAEMGHHVNCVDIDKEKVEMMKAGKIPIFEPDLNVLFERNMAQGRLKFTTSLEEGMERAQVVFLALPTPPGEDGSADLSYILDASKALSRFIKDYTVVVDKSTVPVGTAEKVESVINEQVDSSLFDVVSNPEFLREGVAVDDFMKPDRVIIGTSTEKAAKIMGQLYQPFVRQGNPIIFMDLRSAEMTKYAANSYLATRISFMNEIANICEHVGANVDKVRKGMGSDSRIGKRFLFPGVGYGGSCFPKDVQALAMTARTKAYDFKILNAVMAVNQLQRELFVQKILAYFNHDLKGKKIALWGLAFKPNTDDIREAPSIYIIERLLNEGAKISAYDPEAMNNVARLFGSKIELCETEYAAAMEAEALVVVTEWSEFRAPNLNMLSSKMKSPVIFDGRNLYDPDYMKNNGFYYESIGRP
jgi:UDPglucose 6-dehydrogenase